MADNFLDKFSEKNYTSDISNEKAQEKKNVKPKEIVAEETNIPVSSIPKQATKEARNVFRKHVEHEIDVDYEYQNKRKKRKLIIIITSILAIVIVIASIVMFNLVSVIDGVGKNIGEIKNWANTNNITLEVEYEYSVKYDENIVISQNLEAGKRVFKGKTMKIKVSKGADPEEKIKVPDINAMTLDQINDWVEENKLSNVKITKQFHAEIEKNKVIEYSFENEVTAETYQRKNQLRIIVSKGKEVYEKNIEVKDFSNKSKAEVEEWGKTNEVAIVFEEGASDTIASGMVMSQSVTSGTKVSKEDSITVVISYGKAVIVPSFYGIYKEDATTDYPNLNVVVKEQYHDTIVYGGLISQSVPKGTALREADNTVIVVYSLGKPYIEDLLQMTEKDLAAYFYKFKAAGANITYVVEYISGDSEQKGTIASASKRSEFVGMNEIIYIKVYR
jgi:serine/threonine-protein kinase